MIFSFLLQAFVFLFDSFMSLLDLIPPVPQDIINVVNQFLDVLQTGVNMLALFVDFRLIKILLPLVLIVVNFEFIYKFVMWILRKIPFLSIE